MKKLLALTLGILLLSPFAVPDSTAAETKYPEKPITLLVGFSAGGSSDLGVRMLVPYLERELNTSVNVINKTGANGWIAWTELVKAKPDGYTLSLVNIPGFYSGYLDKKQKRKENLESFQFIANHVTDWGVLVAKKGAFKDMNDFMEQAGTREMTIGDVGLGGNKHMQIEELKRKNPDRKLTPVHMKGWPDNYAGIIGGHIDAASATCADVVSQLQEGEMEILCVFAPKRVELLPEITTCEEAGFGAVYGPSSRGFFMPKGVDAAVLAKLQTAFKNAINDPEHAEKMKKLGVAPDYMAGGQYEQYLKENEENSKSLSGLMGWDK